MTQRDELIEETKPKYWTWRGKMVCNDCPKINDCESVVEWFDPEYSMATYVDGIGFSVRHAPKNNKCPYEMKGEA